MKKEGYPADFSAAVTVASAMVGPIIPPSIGMVIYGALADVSIGRLLLAGILPGITIIIVQMVFTWFLARRRNYPRYARAKLPEVARATWRGSPAHSVSCDHCRWYFVGHLYADGSGCGGSSLWAHIGALVSIGMSVAGNCGTR